MSHHDILTAAYWAAGILAVALLGIWVALNVARQREHRQRIARYDAARREHWDQVKDAFPDCAGDLRPEDDPCIVIQPQNPADAGKTDPHAREGSSVSANEAPGNRNPQRGGRQP